MGRKVKITEEQYKMLQEELTLPLHADDGNLMGAAKEELENAKKYGVNASDITFELPGEKVGESKVISMKQLKESRLKTLRENSNYYTLNDFFKTLK